MFRQSSQVQCHCSLFPTSNLQFQPFRSPQKYTHRKYQSSKISLKYSSQNHKSYFNKISLTKNHINKNNHQKNKENGIGKLKRCTSNIFVENQPPLKPSNQGNIESKLYNYHLNSIYMPSAQTNNIIPQMQTQKYATNFVPIYDKLPSQIYRNEDYYPQIAPRMIQLLKEQSPSFTRIYQTKTQSSTITTLAQSIMPTNKQQKVYLDKINEIKYSISQNRNDQAQNYYGQINIQKPYSHNKRQQSSSKQHNKKQDVYMNNESHFGMLSKLSQILNEKDEAESIYDQASKPQENDIQYSRVLISCKKLMLQKNGYLEPSLQTRLFDSQQINQHQNKSHMFHFDKIKIQ